MPACKKCAGEAEKVYTLLTIRTLTVRGLKGNKHYQAMGEVFDFPLCDACVSEYIESRKTPGNRRWKAARVPALLLLAAIVIFALNLGAAGTVAGMVFAAFAATVFVNELQRVKKDAAQIRDACEADNRRHLVAELAATLLPKKHNDASLTYIELDRVMREDLKLLSAEYAVSYKKLRSIRKFA
ncbi:MAG: hypothetical protein Q4D04_14490, partial [Clostridia bacterium]|nr:hypothetical protein [Clostridia bacterium]